MKTKMIFQPIIFLLCVMAAVIGARNSFCSVNIDADNPNIQYTGRFDFTDKKSPQFSWSGDQIRAVFTGTSCTLRLGVRWDVAYFNVFVDNLPVNVLKVTTAASTYTVATGLADTSHTIYITERNELGMCFFQGFTLDTGRTLAAPPARPARKMEFIGDSYTCGYGAEVTPSNTDAKATEDVYKSFGPIVARSLGAEYVCVSKGGHGLYRNFDSSLATLPTKYERTLHENQSPLWNFAWKPDAVVIFLGLNDSAASAPAVTQAEYETRYKEFIATVRGHYPAAHIICMHAFFWGTTGRTYVQNVVNYENTTLNDSKVHFVEAQPDSWTSSDVAGLGFGGHPTVQGHQKIAAKLLPAVSAFMGWQEDNGGGTDPTFTASPSSLDFGVLAQGQSKTVKCTVTAQGGQITFSAAGDRDWITVSPAHASTSGSVDISVTVDTARLASAVSPLSGTVIITTSSGTSSAIPVSVMVSATDDNNTPDRLKAFPNPYRPAAGASLKISGVIEYGTVKIYTLSGKLVATVTDTDGLGEVTWDGLNKRGSTIKRGLYVYVVKDSEGNTKTGKIVIK